MKDVQKTRDLIHSRLRTRLRIYFVISALILAFVIYNIIKHHVGVLIPAAGLLVGITGGIIFSRIYKIAWDDQANQVVSRMDTFGIVLLVIYILFEVFRERIVGHYFEETTVFSISFALLAGVMYGRVLGMIGRIRSILKNQNIT